jgi:hypothetical protein
MDELTKARGFRRPRRWWWAGLAALVWLPGVWGQAATASANYQVVVDWPGNPAAARELMALVIRTEPIIRRATDGQLAALQLRYQSKRQESVLVGQSWLLPPPPTDAGFAAAVIRQLLHRRVVTWRSDPSYPLAAIPDWVVAAIGFRALHETEGPAPRSYTSYRALLNAGKQPSLRQLLDQPVAPRWPEFYQLYGESCAGVLRLMQQADRQALFALLAKSDPKAFNQAMTKQGLTDPATAQAWFTRQLPRLVWRLDQPSDYEVIRESLQELLTVRILTPGADGEFGFRRVPLEDLALYVKDTARPEIPWEQLRQDCLVMAVECPPLARPAVLAHLKALETLHAGKVDAYRVELAAAQQLLHEASTQGQAIRDWLLDRERVLFSARHRLGPVMDPILQAPLGGEYRQQIQAYLEEREQAAKATSDLP